ncbi:uncharacterized protein VTP21DRAFT_2198 [Calcarisporiella thermophila]|uniref:uncharacterized protein n=1 Tax=Calcarisporiella thermophila TaxID=911321 RepID=UPI0037434C29
MGKGTDKLYITHSEWDGTADPEGASMGGISKKRKLQDFKRLPFNFCALSLQPFEDPVCTPEGIIFDLKYLAPFLKKYGINPVTGQKLSAKSLTKLHFSKNANGEYHCPITFRVFTDHTAITAVRTTGNVYAQDAIDKLNIKPKHWRDLLNDEPFTRKDLIILQDPNDLRLRNLQQFYHLKHNLRVLSEEEEKARADPLYNINTRGTTGRVLAELSEKAKESADSESEGKKLSDYNKPALVGSNPSKPAYNAAHYSTGRAAASFTSTSMDPVLINERALIDEEEFMFKQIKAKGYARIVTNFGNLNLELYCDQTPKTCYNFIMLAKSGYYKNIAFHRKIKHFMIQGGDPTGTGKGGESYWKKDFEDECRSSLKHNERGILSMANRGQNTNSSQFFITFRPCQHLDMKHTIFGRVVGGMEVLDQIEEVDTDDGDRPKQDIKMLDVVVFVDPFEEWKKRLERKQKYQQQATKKEVQSDDTVTWLGTARVTSSASPVGTTKSNGVGKYLAGRQEKRAASTALTANGESVEGPEMGNKKAKQVTGYTFGNFDSW